ncbi:hypothetical protein A6R68_02076, partial [Neotoma lepida]
MKKGSGSQPCPRGGLCSQKKSTKVIIIRITRTEFFSLRLPPPYALLASYDPASSLNLQLGVDPTSIAATTDLDPGQVLQ